MWDSAHWLQDAINNLLNQREQDEFISVLSDYHSRHCVRDLVFSLETLLDTPAKRQLVPLLRHVIPKSDQREFDRHTSRIFEATTPKKGHRNVPPSASADGGPTRNVYPKGVLKKSSSVNMGQDFYPSLPRGRPSSSNSLINPISQSALPTWETSDLINQVKRIYMEQPSNPNAGLGFSIRGGAEHGIGIYVSYVDVESIAERQGLVPGDQILSVNGLAFHKITHDEAARLIKSSPRLELEVRNVGRVPGSFETHQKYTWVDSVGRTVSPPPEVDRVGRYDTNGAGNGGTGGGERKSGLMLLKDSDERKVNLIISESQSLGLMIRGGSEFGLGIYITGLDRHSVAENAGIKVGDQILDVNGTSFLDITHNEAVRVLRSGAQFILTIKDVGKLPYARTTYDHTQWMKGTELPARATPSSSASATLPRSASQGQITRGSAHRDLLFQSPFGTNSKSLFIKGAGSQLMHTSSLSGQRTQLGLLEEAARQLLNSQERQTMAYYVQQYLGKHITVTALMLALLQLFNTDSKFSLTTELRGLVYPLDIEKFDRIVVEKQVDETKGHPEGILAQDDRTSENSLDSISSTSRYSNDSKVDVHVDEMEPLRRALQALRDDPPQTQKPPPPPPSPVPEPPQPPAFLEIPGQHMLKAVEGRDPVSRDPIGRELSLRPLEGSIVVAAEIHHPPQSKPQFDDIRSPSEDSGVDVNGTMMTDPNVTNGHSRVTMSSQEPVIINEVLEDLTDEENEPTHPTPSSRRNGYDHHSPKTDRTNPPHSHSNSRNQSKSNLEQNAIGKIESHASVIRTTDLDSLQNELRVPSDTVLRHNSLRESLKHLSSNSVKSKWESTDAMDDASKEDIPGPNSSHIVKPLTREDLKRKPDSQRGKTRPSLPNFARRKKTSFSDSEERRNGMNGDSENMELRIVEVEDDFNSSMRRSRKEQDTAKKVERKLTPPRKITSYMLPDLQLLPKSKSSKGDEKMVLKTRSRSKSAEPNHFKVKAPDTLDIMSLEKTLSQNNVKVGKLKAVKMRKSSSSSPVSVMQFSYSSDDLEKSAHGHGNGEVDAEVTASSSNHVSRGMPKSRSLDFGGVSRREQGKEERGKRVVRHASSTNRDNVYEEIEYDNHKLNTCVHVVRVDKCRPTLGLAIEGGANTRQPLPKVIKVTPGGCAHACNEVKVGQTLLKVNGTSLLGCSHQDSAKVIAHAFRDRSRDHLTLMVEDPMPATTFKMTL